MSHFTETFIVIALCLLVVRDGRVTDGLFVVGCTVVFSIVQRLWASYWDQELAKYRREGDK